VEFMAAPAGVLKPLEDMTGPLLAAPAGVLKPLDELGAPAGVLKVESALTNAGHTTVKAKIPTPRYFFMAYLLLLERQA